MEAREKSINLFLVYGKGCRRERTKITAVSSRQNS